MHAIEVSKFIRKETFDFQKSMNTRISRPKTSLLECKVDDLRRVQTQRSLKTAGYLKHEMNFTDSDYDRVVTNNPNFRIPKYHLYDTEKMKHSLFGNKGGSEKKSTTDRFFIKKNKETEKRTLIDRFNIRSARHLRVQSNQNARTVRFI